MVVKDEPKISSRWCRYSIGGVSARARAGFEILESCRQRPISINSVLEGLRARRLDDIQEDIEDIVFWSSIIVVE